MVDYKFIPWTQKIEPACISNIYQTRFLLDYSWSQMSQKVKTKHRPRPNTQNNVE